MNHGNLKTAIHARGLKLSHVAGQIGVNKSALWRWDKFRVPAERVAVVENVTGISKHELRPDLYPTEESKS